MQDQEILGAAQSARRIGEASAKFAEIIRRAVRKIVIGLRPHVLGRIEFRRVGGEVVHFEPRVRGEKV